MARLSIFLLAGVACAQSSIHTATVLVQKSCGVIVGSSILSPSTYFGINATSPGTTVSTVTHSSSSASHTSSLSILLSPSSTDNTNGTSSGATTQSTPSVLSSVFTNLITIPIPAEGSTLPVLTSLGTVDSISAPPSQVTVSGSSASLAPSSTIPITGISSSAPTACTIATSAPALSCPASNGALYTPVGQCIGSENSYVVDCGINYGGGGLSVLAGVADAETCITQCSADENCMAVAYDNSTGTCFEKSSVLAGNVSASQNIVFAVNFRYALANGVVPADSPLLNSTSITAVSTAPSTSQQTSSASSASSALASSQSTQQPNVPPTSIAAACPIFDGRNFTDTAGSNWSVACDQVYTGTPLDTQTSAKVRRQSNADACMIGCQTQPSCAGFSWDGSTCSMFSSISATTQQRIGAISAERYTAVAAQSALTPISASTPSPTTSVISVQSSAAQSLAESSPPAISVPASPSPVQATLVSPGPSSSISGTLSRSQTASSSLSSASTDSAFSGTSSSSIATSRSIEASSAVLGSTVISSSTSASFNTPSSPSSASTLPSSYSSAGASSPSLLQPSTIASSIISTSTLVPPLTQSSTLPASASSTGALPAALVSGSTTSYSTIAQSLPSTSQTFSVSSSVLASSTGTPSSASSSLIARYSTPSSTSSNLAPSTSILPQSAIFSSTLSSSPSFTPIAGTSSSLQPQSLLQTTAPASTSSAPVSSPLLTSSGSLSSSVSSSQPSSSQTATSQAQSSPISTTFSSLGSSGVPSTQASSSLSSSLVPSSTANSGSLASSISPSSGSYTSTITGSTGLSTSTGSSIVPSTCSPVPRTTTISHIGAYPSCTEICTVLGPCNSVSYDEDTQLCTLGLPGPPCSSTTSTTSTMNTSSFTSAVTPSSITPAPTPSTVTCGTITNDFSGTFSTCRGTIWDNTGACVSVPNTAACANACTGACQAAYIEPGSTCCWTITAVDEVRTGYVYSTYFAISSITGISSSALSSATPSPTSVISSVSATASNSVSSLAIPTSSSTPSSSLSTVSLTSTSSSVSPTATTVECPGGNGTVYTDSFGSQYKIYCGYDLYDPNSETATVQTSLKSCIDYCDTKFSGSCPGVTWVPTGQSAQWCYEKPATAYIKSSTSNVWSAQKIAGPVISSRVSSTTNRPSTTTLSASSSPAIPTCPTGDQTVYSAADGSTWRLNCNVDYYGNDADQVQATNYKECIDICAARGPTCLGADWIPSRSPNCYLKYALTNSATQTFECDTAVRLSNGNSKASGVTPVCPAADGTTYTVSDGSVFRIDCDVDYPASNWIQRAATSYQICVDTCGEIGTTCAGISYTPSNTTCWIKSAIGTQAPATVHEIDAAVRLSGPAASVTASSTASISSPTANPVCPGGNGTLWWGKDGSQYQLQCGQNWAGNDMSVSVTTSLNDCLKICDARGPTCLGVTWVATGQAATYCYVKSVFDNNSGPYTGVTLDSAGLIYSATTFNDTAFTTCTTGKVYTTSDGSQYTLQCNQDYSVTTTTTLWTRELQTCADACDAYGTGVECLAATWNSASSICSIKTATGSLTPSTSVTAIQRGTVRAPTTGSVQVVRDGAFYGDAQQPWAFRCNTGRCALNIWNGYATISFPKISSTLDSPAELTQDLVRPITGVTTYRLTLNLVLNIPTGTTCQVWYRTNYYTFKSQTYSASTSVAENLSGSISSYGTSQSSFFSIGCSCRGTSTAASCIFDNVLLYLG